MNDTWRKMEENKKGSEIPGCSTIVCICDADGLMQTAAKLNYETWKYMFVHDISQK
jgi:hypothetical protein